MVTQHEILVALHHVVDLDLWMNAVEMGMIRETSTQGDTVDIKMVCHPPFCHVPNTVIE